MSKKKVQSINPTESNLKESCGKCRSKEFSIAKDAGQKRYCAKCNNVWAPLSKDEIHVQAVLADNAKLKDENQDLKRQLDAIGAAQPAINSPTETPDLFS